MDKRVIVAIALCLGVLIVWTQLFSPPPKPPAPPVATSPAGADGGQAAGAPAAPVGGATAPAAAPGTATAPVTNRPEQKLELMTPNVRFVFSSLGGTLAHAKLLEKQFLDNPKDPTTGHDIVRAANSQERPFRISFLEGLTAPPDGAWEVSQPTPDTVVFAADSGNVHIEKRYRADTARYRLSLDVVLSNRGDAPVNHNLAISVNGRQDPDKRGGGIFSAVSANVASTVCYVNGKVERESIEGLTTTPKTHPGAITWVATDEKFFLLSAVPYMEPPGRDRTCAMMSTGADAGLVRLSFAQRTVPPKGEISYPFVVYAGPKRIEDLEQVRPPADPSTPAVAGTEVQLDEAVDVTLAILSRPILTVLKFFHRFAHNWGLAIVLLTIFIKALTFYPTQKSLMSGKRMQKLAPKMAAIRKKYENDRQRMSQETMNLYKAHGVSPVGGCLPMLIQMPIWIALYSTLNYAVELYRAPFFAHIQDLTAKDPFYITPLVMGGVMVLQMRMSPAGADKQQQAIMSVMMPIMFTVFSLFLPAGLALYMLTSYLIGIVQQLYVNHLDKKGAIGV
jgi:YidC/Oxa1 family membrane protein insertase